MHDAQVDLDDVAAAREEALLGQGFRDEGVWLRFYFSILSSKLVTASAR